MGPEAPRPEYTEEQLGGFIDELLPDEAVQGVIEEITENSDEALHVLKDYGFAVDQINFREMAFKNLAEKNEAHLRRRLHEIGGLAVMSGITISAWSAIFEVMASSEATPNKGVWVGAGIIGAGVVSMALGRFKKFRPRI